jgi:PKD repeat protein
MNRKNASTRVFVVLAMLATGLVANINEVAAAGENTATLPSDNPANWTPNVLDGQIDSIWQIGSKVIIGGTFSQIANSTSNGGTVYNRSNIAAFDATTGVVDTSFAPVLNAPVEVVVPAGDGTSVYVGGSFNTVNGTNRRKVARIDLASGELVEPFNANGVNGIVRDIRVSGGEVYIAGLFTWVGGYPRTYLASLDGQTGNVTDHIDVPIDGVHNGGTSKVTKIDITPDGSRLLIMGNFTTVAGQNRDQIAVIDVASEPAVLSPWHTNFFTSSCSSSFDTFMRDLDISEDGTYAVVSTTGAYRANTSCDTISRFELDAELPNLMPTWISYTGGDTTYAVEIHDGVAFVGGHMRWVNNPYAADRHGAGGVGRQGMGALDVVTGLPFSWNPGRDRGVGLFDYHVTDQGLWAGSDTDRWNDETRMKLAFFPWSTGTQVPSSEIGSLPNDIFQLGRTAGTTGTVDPSVLYRVNAGGPALASVDDGPDWAADTASSSPYRNSGSSTSTAPSGLATPTNDAAVPKDDFDRPPAHLWTTERYDPAGGAEMQWTFPVAAGTPIRVRLYLSNRCRCTDQGGERIFDVDLDGVNVIDDLDLTGQVGHDVGTMRSFDIVSDGTVDISFRHGAAENPLVDGIEIIRLDVPAGSSVGTQDDVTQHHFDGVNAPTGGLATGGTAPWRTVTSAFMVNSTLYTMHVDGTVMRRSLNGSAFGSGVPIDMWSNDIMADMASMTGIFFDPATSQIYYTLAGQSSLYARAFLPESHMIGANRTTTTGAVTALNPSRVRGMFLGNGRLWFGDATSGNLLSIEYAGGAVSGTPTVADTTIDWRSRALFRSSGAQPNVPPVANFSSSCALDECSFDATTSTDSDGSIVSYAWDFGDGSTGTGIDTRHAYVNGGRYSVTLTVADDRGGVDQHIADVTVADPANIPPAASFTTSCDLLTCSFDATTSTDSDGSIVSYAWDFGDGSTDTGRDAQHSYDDAGEFHVTLVVTDDEAATGSAEADVQVIAPGGAAVFRASASANSWGSSASITVPAEVQPGDQLVYVVTSATATTIDTPTGWTLLATQQDGAPDMTSSVFTRTADATTPGMSVSAVLGQSSKSARLLVAYQNALPPTAATASVMGATSFDLTTPAVDVDYSGSAVVSYWSDRSSGNTGWTLPTSVVGRASSIGSGGGRITAAIADTNVPAGNWPGATATSTAAGTKGIGWTIVLAPSTGNLAPVANFTSSCALRDCRFDASTSVDPDGTIVEYQWNFGDGGAATGPTTTHAFGLDGTYTVQLTLTDDDGATATSTINLQVSLAVVGFRSSASNNANSGTASVTVPNNVQAGDQLVLFVTANGAVNAATPPGWTLLGSAEAGSPDIRSFVYSRTADVTSAGTSVDVALGSTQKSSTVVLAYSNAGPISTATSVVAGSSSTDLTTPQVTVVTSGSRIVSYWVDKTSGNTGWTLPDIVTLRESSTGSGGGRITAAAGDSAVVAGTWPGATASGTVSGSKAIGWSVVVPVP